MTHIKYIGKSPRMLVDKFLFQGDERELNPKLLFLVENDSNFVIAQKYPEILPVPGVILVPEDQLPLEEEILPEAVDETITDEQIEEFVKPPKKSRSKKK